MDASDIKRVLDLAATFLGPLAERTDTKLDDIGLELARAIADSPAMLDFLAKYVGKDELNGLVAKMVS